MSIVCQCISPWRNYRRIFGNEKPIFAQVISPKTNEKKKNKQVLKKKRILSQKYNSHCLLILLNIQKNCKSLQDLRKLFSFLQKQKIDKTCRETRFFYFFGNMCVIESLTT